MHLARHVAGACEHRRMIAAGFIEAGDQMRAAGAGGTGTHGELAGERSLTGGGKRPTFLVADPNPFDLAAPDRIGKWLERLLYHTYDIFYPAMLQGTAQ